MVCQITDVDEKTHIYEGFKSLQEALCLYLEAYSKWHYYALVEHKEEACDVPHALPCVVWREHAFALLYVVLRGLHVDLVLLKVLEVI